MIRKLTADELPWFLARAYSFMGHVDPDGFARRAVNAMRDPGREAQRCLVLFGDSGPVAGVHVLPPNEDDGERQLTLALSWFDSEAGDLLRLLEEVLARHPHEVVYYPLHNLPHAQIGPLSRLLAPAGFTFERLVDLRFFLADVPPLGMPLVLEAWNPESDEGFRDLYERAEGGPVGDAYWAWLKRRRSPFTPDLWFIARETLDQEPVGYGFCGRQHRGVAGRFYLAAVGVTREHRGSSEMLRRLVLSVLHELASRSPLGSVATTVSADDPKLVSILRSLGFEVVEETSALVKWPPR